MVERLTPTREIPGDGWMVARLPKVVQDYLTEIGICRNPVTPLAERITSNEKQIALLDKMTDEDMTSLVGYVSWKKQRMTPDPKVVE